MNQIFEGMVVEEIAEPPLALGDNPSSTFKVENALAGLASSGMRAFFHLDRGALRVGDHVRISLEKIAKEGS